MVRKVVVCALLLFLTGCTARHTAGPVQLGTFFQVKRVSFWLRAPRTRDPLKADGATIELGRNVYANSCAICHGPDGKGTPMGLAMYPPSTDLTSKYAQGYSDRELYFLLWNGIGHTGMPGWHDQLQPEQVWQVMHYMRTLPDAVKPTPNSDAALARQAAIAHGRELFTKEECGTCHRLGDGPPGDSPDLTFEGDRGRSQEWLVAHFIDPAAYSPGSDMPSFGKLSGNDLNDLSLFLQSRRFGR